jgi:tRNA(Leu) C34 or U34 (ribose-2'-O)-methylase TrmL
MKKHNERPPIDLIADGISDPRNVPALLALADMLHCRCLFRDRHELRSQLADTPLAARMIEAPPLEQFADHYDLLLAVENHEKARSIFEYRPPRGKRLAMVVGNERKGLDRKVSRLADVMLEIPMRLRPGISLNVASAASAALYQLLGAVEAGRHKRTRGLHRPDLIFWEPHDAADLGTSLRSAYALGWESARVVDTQRVWFGADRETTAQGRGAARRHKTSIRVRPLDPAAPRETFDVAVLLASGVSGTAVRRLRLPDRGSCALVFSDSPVTAESVTAVAREVWPISLDDEPATPSDAPLRIFSAITLTEVARVVR